MASIRRVDIHNTDGISIDEKALKRLVRHYYKGSEDIEIRFDNRLTSTWGSHTYSTERKCHLIQLSPLMCSHNRAQVNYDWDHLLVQWALVKMNRHDTVCRIIQVLLHEIKHAEQCDAMGYEKYNSTPSKNQDITQCRLGYELDPYECEAEGWSLTNFNRALEKYKSWAQEDNAG